MMDFIFSFLSPEWILFFNRIVLGAVMIYYGAPKIRDLKTNAKEFNDWGFKPGILWGTLVALELFFGGLFILLGFYAELFAFFMALVMIVGVLWKIKNNQVWEHLIENFHNLAMCLVLISFGPGLFNIISSF
ncbi:MAG: DoxX family protein [bacterium]|nr:DoxX family protein [bacterium]